MIEIRPTDDFATLRRRGVENGLEPGGRTDGERLGLWVARDGEETVGGVALERLDGLPVVTWLWVARTHRRRGIASRLLDAVETEATRRHIATLWAAARTPGVFLRRGYTPVPPGTERDALLADCEGCSQRGGACSPEAVSRRSRVERRRRG